jgi:hypothetical protein
MSLSYVILLQIGMPVLARLFVTNPTILGFGLPDHVWSHVTLNKIFLIILIHDSPILLYEFNISHKSLKNKMVESCMRITEESFVQRGIGVLHDLEGQTIRWLVSGFELEKEVTGERWLVLRYIFFCAGCLL